MIKDTVCVHLLSGGMDSVTMLYDLVADKIPVFAVGFNYGQAHKNELNQAKFHADKLGVKYKLITLPALDGLKAPSWQVANRNLIFLSLAVNQAVKVGANLITIGCNADDADNFPDCRYDFVTATQKCVSLAGYDIEIKAPYINVNKKQIAKKARHFGILKNQLIWCYKGEINGCGNCGACKKMEDAW